MENGRKELYGFESVSGDKLVVYSANNALARVQDLSNNSDILFVGVFAPDRTREKRLIERSTDMLSAERSFRLNEPSRDIIPFVHVLINNSDENEAVSLEEIVQLTNLLKEIYNK